MYGSVVISFLSAIVCFRKWNCHVQQTNMAGMGNAFLAELKCALRKLNPAPDDISHCELEEHGDDKCEGGAGERRTLGGILVRRGSSIKKYTTCQRCKERITTDTEKPTPSPSKCDTKALNVSVAEESDVPNYSPLVCDQSIEACESQPESDQALAVDEEPLDISQINEQEKSSDTESQNMNISDAAIVPPSEMAKSELYNELNFVLKKRNAEGRSDSVIDLECRKPVEKTKPIFGSEDREESPLKFPYPPPIDIPLPECPDVSETEAVATPTPPPLAESDYKRPPTGSTKIASHRIFGTEAFKQFLKLDISMSASPPKSTQVPKLERIHRVVDSTSSLDISSLDLSSPEVFNHYSLEKLPRSRPRFVKCQSESDVFKRSASARSPRYNFSESISFADVLDAASSRNMLHRSPCPLDEGPPLMISDTDKEISDEDSELQSCTLPPMDDDDEDMSSELQQLELDYFGDSDCQGPLEGTKDTTQLTPVRVESVPPEEHHDLVVDITTPSPQGHRVGTVRLETPQKEFILLDSPKPSTTIRDTPMPPKDYPMDDHDTPPAQISDSTLNDDPHDTSHEPSSDKTLLKVPQQDSTCEESDSTMARTTVEYLDSFDSISSVTKNQPSTLVSHIVRKASSLKREPSSTKWQSDTDKSSLSSKQAVTSYEASSEISTDESSQRETTPKPITFGTNTPYPKSSDLLARVGAPCPLGILSEGSLTTVTSCEQMMNEAARKFDIVTDPTSSNDESISNTSLELRLSRHRWASPSLDHTKAKSWDAIIYGSNSSLETVKADSDETKPKKPEQNVSKVKGASRRVYSQPCMSENKTPKGKKESKSLESVLGLKSKWYMSPGHINDDAANGQYATYPPPKSIHRINSELDDEAMASLFITHSGEHLPLPGNRHPHLLSKVVSIPRINTVRSTGAKSLSSSSHRVQSPDGSDPLFSGSSYTEGSEFRVSSQALYDPPYSSHSDDEASDNLSDTKYRAHPHFQRRALDKEGQRHHLYHTWTTTAARIAREKSLHYHWRKTLRHIPEDESEASGSYSRDTYSRNSRDSPWCDQFHLASRPYEKKAKYSDNTNVEDISTDGRRKYTLKHESCFGRTATPSAYVSDKLNHSSDADAESIYQDYDDYERSLIEYVKTEDLSQITEDIRSRYWQQFDAISMAGMPVQSHGLLRRLFKCIICDGRPTYQRRMVTRKNVPHSKWNTGMIPLIARFVGPTWGPSGADRTQVGPMLAPWTLLSGTAWVVFCNRACQLGTIVGTTNLVLYHPCQIIYLI